MMSVHDAHSIPWKELIVPQAVNFTIFVSALVYLARKPIKEYFSKKNESFESEKKKAEAIKVDAEKQNFEVRNQLRVLEESTHKDIEKAHNEANLVKAKLIKDAEETAKRLSHEAKKMAEFEYYRAITALKTEFIANSTQLAQENLGANSENPKINELNNEFVKKVQLVNR